MIQHSPTDFTGIDMLLCQRLWNMLNGSFHLAGQIDQWRVGHRDCSCCGGSRSVFIGWTSLGRGIFRSSPWCSRRLNRSILNLNLNAWKLKLSVLKQQHLLLLTSSVSVQLNQDGTRRKGLGFTEGDSNWNGTSQQSAHRNSRPQHVFNNVLWKISHRQRYTYQEDPITWLQLAQYS